MKRIRDSIKGLLPRNIVEAIDREHQKETHINRVLSRKKAPRIYLEIGVRDGACIRRIHAEERIAVDPNPLFEEDKDIWGGVDLYKTTSDEFFATTGCKLVDVALVDGLHEFRQALRDVLNLEKLMSPDGVIFIHDCNPITRRHQDDKNFTWNGDVWKVADYLQRFRPELKFVTLDCDWGLGIVSGFDKNPPAPRTRDIEHVAGLDYSVLEKDRRKILNLRHPMLGRFIA